MSLVRNQKTIRVLNVDDSASVRVVLKELLGNAPDIEVVGQAHDAMQAKEMLTTLDPDVITLDVEMPGMSGIEFLEKLMKLRPTPVVMLSTLTQQGSDTAVRALELGAVDIIGKPSARGSELRTYQDEILTKVRAAASARVGNRKPQISAPTDTSDIAGMVTPMLDADAILPLTDKAPTHRSPIIAIGASTGGTEAIRNLLSALPQELPPIVVTQHMSAGFTASFAKRLNDNTPFEVHEARDGMPLRDGHVYIAPGSAHLAVRKQATGYVCQLIEGSPVNRHKPAVDVLFRSVANAVGDSAAGVILTGMGEDGAKGLLEMRNFNAFTLAQNADSCIVYGMPRAAMEMGAAQKEGDLNKLAQLIKEKYA